MKIRLSEIKGATDITDGLARELEIISKKSNVGIKIYEDKIPCPKEVETIAKYYNKNPEEYILHYGEDFESSGHLYLVRLVGRTRGDVNCVIERMAERGIACNVHYKPLPMMTAYKKLGFDIANYPNAFALFENEVTLPLNTKMSNEDVEYVIENFIEVVKGL